MRLWWKKFPPPWHTVNIVEEIPPCDALHMPHCGRISPHPSAALRDNGGGIYPQRLRKHATSPPSKAIPQSAVVYGGRIYPGGSGAVAVSGHRKFCLKHRISNVEEFPPGGRPIICPVLPFCYVCSLRTDGINNDCGAIFVHELHSVHF
jgi:hypothetical protein